MISKFKSKYEKLKATVEETKNNFIAAMESVHEIKPRVSEAYNLYQKLDEQAFECRKKERESRIKYEEAMDALRNYEKKNCEPS